MLTTLLLCTQLAHAGSDVGTEKKFGVGVSTGDPAVAFTGKFWLSDHAGIAFYAGTSFVHHSVRASFQSNIHTWGEDWSFGRLPLYWHAGVDAGLYTVLGYVAPTVGVNGGVGVALQFDAVPAEVFAEAGLHVGYNGYCGVSYYTGSAVGCWVSGMGAAGGRWYF